MAPQLHRRRRGFPQNPRGKPAHTTARLLAGCLTVFLNQALADEESREFGARADVQLSVGCASETSGTPEENQPLRAGVCYTSTTLIHLRSIDVNNPAPDGWSGPIAPVKLGNGVTYVTYWLLTPR